MSNPHRISIFLILLLFLGLIFVAVSDLLSFHEDDFDLSEALVQVQVQTPRHYDSSDVEEPVNYLLASKRRIHSCDPFTADEATVYYVPSECFDAYIDRAQNKVLNRLVSVAVTDGNGTPLEAPAVLPDIFAQIATLEHTLFDIRILDVSSEYFVFLKLNVNLHTPCELYYYNQQIGKLIELYSFNDRELLGLHVMSVERLKRAIVFRRSLLIFMLPFQEDFSLLLSVQSFLLLASNLPDTLFRDRQIFRHLRRFR